jgi:hypothetical protein
MRKDARAFSGVDVAKDRLDERFLRTSWRVAHRAQPGRSDFFTALGGG